MLKASILTIGDEICIGQVINTNASWISSELTKIGCKVHIHSVIGDQKDLLNQELDRLISRSDIIITTGGLGPTHDDITKLALAEYFGDKLILNNDLLIELQERFSKRGLKLTKRNREQALVPTKARILRNNLGTAPGLWFDYHNKHIIALPGVPSEMKFIMQDSVLPSIKVEISKNNDSVIIYKSLNTSGIPESFLADLIGDPSSFLEGGSLAFLPSYHGVRLRIGMEGANLILAQSKLQKIENYIKQKAGKYIYSEDDKDLASTIGIILSKKNITISVAESCTGGLLGAEITSVSGSSKYFLGGVQVYSNEAKIKLLNLPSDIITNYGAVCEQTAIELALNVRILFSSDIGISITGIAGPTGGSEEKPVGTVFIGIADSINAFANKYSFGTDRNINREKAVGAALALLYRYLLGTKDS